MVMSFLKQLFYSLRFLVTVSQNNFFTFVGQNLEALIDDLILGIHNPNHNKLINSLNQLLFELTKIVCLLGETSNLASNILQSILSARMQFLTLN